VQLLNLIALTLRRIFTPAPKASVRPTMIIPSLRDLRDGRQAATVQSQCQQCAKQLAGRLYVWPKPFPGKATVKSWSTDTQSFISMTIEDFANFVMANFTLKTSDGKEWLLDKAVAVRIWAACVEEDSPLPEASWEVEITLKREAARK
jgi:hypothetical protein